MLNSAVLPDLSTFENASRPQQIDQRTTMRNQNISAALGRPAMKLLGGGGFNLFAVDQPLLLVLPWFLRYLVVWFALKIPSS